MGGTSVILLGLKGTPDHCCEEMVKDILHVR